ncbi:hypothetical protein Vadar_011901 [Vaccinium darrowii]|nr:hypothetical protein Vadar_011901 [Vaccinium darrowii]
MEGAGEDSVDEEVDEGACNKNPVSPPFPPPVQKVGDVSEIFEVPPTCENQKNQIMPVEIPTTTIEGSTEDFIRINMPPTPNRTPKRVNFSPRHSPILYRFNDSPSPLSRGKSSIKNLLPKLSFKFRNTNSEQEKAAILALGGSPVGSQQKPIQRTTSLTKLFAPKMRRTSSLPVTPIEHSNPESMHGGNTNNYYAKSGTKHPIHRSRSVPELNKDGSIRQIDSSSGVIRVVLTAPRVADGNLAALTIAPTTDADGNDDGCEDIPEEEAVCRICFVELGEDADTLKMECSCKGELALAHQECAIKWFSIKGNKTCEVCKQEVQNLPVTLLRIQSTQSHNLRGNRARQVETPRYSVWQDVPVLVIVSMLAYFCFLEQLLVTKLGSGAIAISLPFSCILGLLASMTSATMVKRKFAWLYATIQFGLVVLFAHIFYLLLHGLAVLAILLATVAGFGGTMVGTSVLLGFLKARGRRQSRSNRHQGSVTQLHQLPETVNTPETDPLPETETTYTRIERVS